MTTINRKYIYILIGLLLFVSSTWVYMENNNTKHYKSHDYQHDSIHIFKGTPAWFLAKAIYQEDLWRIKWILKKDPTLLSYKEPKYDSTVVTYAMKSDKLEALMTMVTVSQNPNLIGDSHIRTSPMLTYFIELADFELDRDFSLATNPFVKYRSKAAYVKALLELGADPNLVYVYEGYDIFEHTTALIDAVEEGNLELVKLLVNYGADINYKNEYGVTATVAALYRALGRKGNFDEGICDYLIFEKKADLSGSSWYYNRNNKKADFINNVLILKEWDFKEGTPEYRIKEKYIEKFKLFGQIYTEGL